MGWRRDRSRPRRWPRPRGEEYPLAVVKDGRRLLVVEVRERKRRRDAATGTLHETFVCRLENGEIVTIERAV